MSEVQEQCIEAVQHLNVWRRRGERAPHKPLLVLFALSRAMRSSERLIPFKELSDPFKKLLLGFGIDRASAHPEYPFWRLETNIWEVVPRSELRLRKSNSDPPHKELLRVNAQGGFLEPIWSELQADPKFACRIGCVVLHSYFPGVLHSNLCSAVGLDIPSGWTWPESMPCRATQ
jgi:putative restriction endonuclease